MDSAPNPLARGATRLFAVRRRLGCRSGAPCGRRRTRGATISGAGDGSVDAMLADLAMRDADERVGGPCGAARPQVRRAVRAAARAAPLRRFPRPSRAPRCPRCCSRPATSAMPTTRCCCATPQAARADRRWRWRRRSRPTSPRACAPLELPPGMPNSARRTQRMKFERLNVPQWPLPDLVAFNRRVHERVDPWWRAPLGAPRHLGRPRRSSPCSPRCGSISRADCRRRRRLLAYQPPLPTNVRGYDGNAGPDLRPRAAGRARL